MRLIDADKLILSVRKWAEDEHSKRTSTTWADAFEDFIDIIENAPAIEAMPVKHANWIEVIVCCGAPEPAAVTKMEKNDE